MPDDLIPEAAAPTETQAPTETTTSEDAVYDNAFQELMGGGEPDDSPKSGEQDTNQEANSEPGKPVLTYGQQQVLSRSKIDPALVQSWSQEQIDGFVEALRTQQSQQDSLGAELARLKQGSSEEPEEETTEETEQKAPSKFRERIESVKAQLTESYDESIHPLFDLLSEFEDRFAPMLDSFQQHEGVLNPMAGLTTEMALDHVLNSLERDYPTLGKPEARDRVVDRFWTEWKTGAYSNPERSLLGNIREAAKNAAKVTFNNVTEHSAVASLVSANRSRVSSQPKVGGSSRAPNRPRTEDEMYAEAFEKTLGRELSPGR